MIYDIGSQINRNRPNDLEIVFKLFPQIILELYCMQLIPSTLAPFFQEYEFGKLDPQRDSATIIERVLRFGTRAELSWLFHTYSRQRIAGWVQTWGRFALPTPHLAFWRLMLEVE